MTEADAISLVLQALRQVKHAQHEEHNLVELEMIQHVAFEGRQLLVTVGLPFSNTSYKDQLLRDVHYALARLNTGFDVHVDTLHLSST